jgi:stage II sporulation protein D
VRRAWRVFPAFVLILNCAAASAQSVRIGVLGIFHPRQLTLSPGAGQSLVLTASGQTIFLPSTPNSGIAYIRSSGNILVIELDGKTIRSKGIHAASTNNETAAFVLGVPGKIKRQYRGTIDIKSAAGALIPIITMDLETAVSSIVQAESDANASFEALKAQAIVTRSYVLAGGGRHADFDFCDLTHCQFLREPPNPESPVALATSETRGLVLSYEGKTLAAMFTRSCGGQTRTLGAIGIPVKSYPYFSVRCDVCYRNPVRWTRQLSPQDAATLFARGEAGRLAIGRRLGWSAVPSNNFTAQTVDGEVLVHGVGQGHGVGFCQRGAQARSAEGADFRGILRHYFPNTTIGSV